MLELGYLACNILKVLFINFCIYSKKKKKRVYPITSLPFFSQRNFSLYYALF